MHVANRTVVFGHTAGKCLGLRIVFASTSSTPATPLQPFRSPGHIPATQRRIPLFVTSLELRRADPLVPNAHYTAFWQATPDWAVLDHVSRLLLHLRHVQVMFTNESSARRFVIEGGLETQMKYLVESGKLWVGWRTRWDGEIVMRYAQVLDYFASVALLDDGEDKAWDDGSSVVSFPPSPSDTYEID